MDRDTRRFKLDKAFKDSFLSFREKLDIADFDLLKFLAHHENLHSLPIVSIAKHLCGGATDLALTSLSLQDPLLIAGVSIATCCHHCCDTATYVNLPYLEALGFTEEELTILPRISSWAIS